MSIFRVRVMYSGYAGLQGFNESRGLKANSIDVHNRHTSEKQRENHYFSPSCGFIFSKIPALKCL